MTPRIRIATLAVLAIVFALQSRGGTQRNIVLLVADDLGWSDLGCYGSSFHQTPAIDSFASTGLRFTQAYAAGAVCSPTRASIATGRYPVRTGVTDWIPGMEAPKGARLIPPKNASRLADDEVTYSEVLAAAGYETVYIGKWHLGEHGAGPETQGFTRVVPRVVGGEGGGGGKDRLTALKGSSDTYIEAALEFLRTRNIDKPFLLVIGFDDPHTPIQSRERWIAPFRAKADMLAMPTPSAPEHQGVTRLRQDDPAYASTIANLDWNVGRLFQAITDLGISGSTAIVFTSDNGGLSTQQRAGPTSNAPLRAGKGWLYEGGVRIPLIVRVPGLTSGGGVSDVPVVTMDLFPTVLELAGKPLRPELHLDGRSLMSTLSGSSEPVHEKLFWHYPHYHGSTWAPGGAIRRGAWKLIEHFERGESELFNLVSDPFEKVDLAAAHPELVRDLAAELANWRLQTGAANPKVRAPTLTQSQLSVRPSD